MAHDLHFTVYGDSRPARAGEKVQAHCLAHNVSSGAHDSEQDAALNVFERCATTAPDGRIGARIRRML